MHIDAVGIELLLLSTPLFLFKILHLCPALKDI
jgi:hypothetical protein